MVLLTAVLRSDITIALSFEIPPFLENGTDFRDQEPTKVPLRAAHNTPLVSPLVPFADCMQALEMHPATASILDDMRFLITTVLSLPANPSPKEMRKLHTTSVWIHDRIAKLPASSPMPPRPSQKSPASPAHLPPGTPSEAAVPLTPQPEAQAPVQMLTPPESGQDSSQGSSVHTASRRASTQSLHPETAISTAAETASQQRSRQPTRTPSPRPPPSPAGLTAGSPDILYQTVRQTALIYSRAIMRRQPFSEVVEPAEFLELWTSTWRVSLTSWKGRVGIFTWIMLAIVASARDTPHDRFVKSMLSICSVQLSLENWEIASAALRAALKLGAWLQGGEKEDDVAAADAKEDLKEGVEVMLDFETEERTEFSGGGKAIREQGSTVPNWNS